MTAYTEVKVRNRNGIGFFLLFGFIFFILALFAVGNKHIYMNSVQYIKSNCEPGDFFAQAVNIKTGEMFEFCRIDDSTIGVLISKRGRIKGGYTFTTKRYTQKDLLSFIRKKGLELINFADDVIPKE